MNRRHAATIALQAPGGQRWRDPSELVGRDVCPHCKRPAVSHLFACDGHWVSSYSCPAHGDIVPILSAVVNLTPARAPDRSAA